MDITTIKGAFRLADLAPYQEGGINRVNVEENDKMKVFIMAFDKEMLLAEHVAPGNAILTVLEGRVGIQMEGDEVNLSKGESIVFRKGVRHSVYAPEQAKVLLVLNMA